MSVTSEIEKMEISSKEKLSESYSLLDSDFASKDISLDKFFNLILCLIYGHSCNPCDWT